MFSPEEEDHAQTLPHRSKSHGRTPTICILRLGRLVLRYALPLKKKKKRKKHKLSELVLKISFGTCFPYFGFNSGKANAMGSFCRVIDFVSNALDFELSSRSALVEHGRGGGEGWGGGGKHRTILVCPLEVLPLPLSSQYLFGKHFWGRGRVFIVQDVLDRAHVPSGTKTVLIEGEPGSGKTILLSKVVAATNGWLPPPAIPTARGGLSVCLSLFEQYALWQEACAFDAVMFRCAASGSKSV